MYNKIQVPINEIIKNIAQKKRIVMVFRHPSNLQHWKDQYLASLIKYYGTWYAAQNTVKFPNGASILLVVMDSIKDGEKVRGITFDDCIFDNHVERDVKSLIQSCVRSVGKDE